MCVIMKKYSYSCHTRILEILEEILYIVAKMNHDVSYFCACHYKATFESLPVNEYAVLLIMAEGKVYKNNNKTQKNIKC